MYLEQSEKKIDFFLIFLLCVSLSIISLAIIIIFYETQAFLYPLVIVAPYVILLLDYIKDRRKEKKKEQMKKKNLKKDLDSAQELGYLVKTIFESF